MSNNSPRLTTVFCTLQVDGLHNWPECPFDEVDFLRPLHRHVFHIRAYMPVHHNDRDVEFIMFKHQLVKWFRDNYWNEEKQTHVFGRMSCETIGQLLHDRFGLIQVEVSEDNENGAVMYWEEV